MSLTLDQFNAGLEVDDYWPLLKTNQAAIKQVFETVQPPAEAKAFFDGLAEPLRQSLYNAFHSTADWMRNKPGDLPEAITRLHGG